MPQVLRSNGCLDTSSNWHQQEQRLFACVRCHEPLVPGTAERGHRMTIMTCAPGDDGPCYGVIATDTILRPVILQQHPSRANAAVYSPFSCTHEAFNQAMYYSMWCFCKKASKPFASPFVTTAQAGYSCCICSETEGFMCLHDVLLMVRGGI